MLLKKQNHQHLILLAYVLGVIAIILSLILWGWTKTWQHLHIPTYYPPYMDMRTIQGSLISIAQGLNPQLQNPGDPWGRAMNYPRIWVDIARWLHFGTESDFIIAVTLIVLCYVACCFSILKKFPSAILLLLMFSGASLLGIERGNNDLIVFSLLYVASLSSSLNLSGSLILISSVLKIYPVFAFSAFLRNRLSFIWFLLTGILVVALNYSDFSSIRGSTPASATLSYGAASLALFIKNTFSIAANPWLIGLMHIAFPIAALFLIKPLKSDDKSTPPDIVSMFMTGASIFTATFLLSSNWDYRLIFLILCVPYINQTLPPIRKTGVYLFLLAAFNYSTLSAYFGKYGYAINLFSKSALFEIFFYLLLLLFLPIVQSRFSERQRQTTAYRTAS